MTGNAATLGQWQGAILAPNQHLHFCRKCFGYDEAITLVV